MREHDDELMLLEVSRWQREAAQRLGITLDHLKIVPTSKPWEDGERALDEQLKEAARHRD